MELMYAIFEDLPRQGPGERAATERALCAVPDLPAAPDILDVGCGTGMQTLDLAGLTAGRITAVDNHEPFLATLRRRAARLAGGAAVEARRGDMAALDLPPASFDLIWSEGAAYLMGFAAAIEAWTPLLRPGGSLVISEICWFDTDGPADLKEFWEQGYPAITTHAGNRALAEAAGCEVVESFKLSAEAWWTDFYGPMEHKLVELRLEHPDSEAQALFDEFRDEIEMHRRYSKYYGYGFYVLRPRP